MWASGQSSWLQIQRSGLDSRRYHIFWDVAALERGVGFSRGQPTRVGPLAWLGLWLIYIKVASCEMWLRATNWRNYLDRQPKLREVDMRFGTWNVRSLYRAGSLVTVSKEPSKCKFDLVWAQEVTMGRVGIEPASEYRFAVERGTRIIDWAQVFLYVR
jgi:hypothetical protein